jgi:hypothetical protein
VEASCYGQHDANWLGFYDYFRIACSLDKETMNLCGLWEIAKNAGWFLPHKNLCWISDRHITLYRNTAGRLHREGAMALSYPDGWGIYALNGVRMSPAHVLTLAEQIDPKTILNEKNAEVRRELLRKIGIERFLGVCKHRVMDTRGDYALLSVPLSDEVKDARYLKMLNPSIGVWHVEAVAPECDTVQHALNWRASQKTNEQWKPEILT